MKFYTLKNCNWIRTVNYMKIILIYLLLIMLIYYI